MEELTAMDIKAKLIGLNKFLSEVHDTETRLSTLLADMVISEESINCLRHEHHTFLVEEMVEFLTQQLRNERLARIMVRRYGLDGMPSCTLQELGTELGISRERVRQLEQKATRRCRGKGFRRDFSRHLHQIAIERLGEVVAPPDTKTLIDKLDELAKIRSAIEDTRANYEARREEVLSRVKSELDALSEEYAQLTAPAQDFAARLEAEIYTEVLLHRSTVRASTLLAVYSRGRVTWDTKGIAKLAETYPELLDYRKEGYPTVSIRARTSPRSSDGLLVRGPSSTLDKSKTYSVAVVRRKHANAYARWSPDDDQTLREQHATGSEIAEMALNMGRNEGAIRSRLRKLGLMA